MFTEAFSNEKYVDHSAWTVNGILSFTDGAPSGFKAFSLLSRKADQAPVLFLPGIL